MIDRFFSWLIRWTLTHLIDQLTDEEAEELLAYAEKLKGSKQ